MSVCVCVSIQEVYNLNFIFHLTQIWNYIHSCIKINNFNIYVYVVYVYMNANFPHNKLYDNIMKTKKKMGNVYNEINI